MKIKINILAVILIAVGIVSLVSGAYYYYTNLSGGTFSNTLYNSTGNYVYLNYTDATNTSYAVNGTYTSSVIDFGTVTGFSEIRWMGNGTCLGNMSYIDKFGGYCIDQYEAYNAGSSIAGSASGKTPWVSISQTSARTYCANAGKHLCSSLEWLGAANMQGKVYNLPTDLAVSPYYCNTGTSAAKLTGNSSGCVSAEGVYDMVGNVWEWVNESIITISPTGCTTCYPNSTGGFASSTGESTLKYGNDVVTFSSGTNWRAVRRGGLWSNGADAGPFAMNLLNAPGDTNPIIGFRCCSSAS